MDTCQRRVYHSGEIASVDGLTLKTLLITSIRQRRAICWAAMNIESRPSSNLRGFMRGLLMSSCWRPGGRRLVGKLAGMFEQGSKVLAYQPLDPWIA